MLEQLIETTFEYLGVTYNMTYLKRHGNKFIDGSYRQIEEDQNVLCFFASFKGEDNSNFFFDNEKIFEFNIQTNKLIFPNFRRKHNQYELKLPIALAIIVKEKLNHQEYLKY